jgi:hypothetical protein
VDALDLGALGIEPHDGEQPMPDDLGAQRLDRAEDRRGLIRGTQRLDELREVVEAQLAPHRHPPRPIRCGLSTL